jgi:4-hydroxy-3-methylbut-2-enyl diphosphate reductase
VIESEEDAEAIEVDDPTKVVYLTQTTLSTDDAGRIITILKRRFPEIKAPPGEDICYATTNRQGVVAKFANHVDRVLVIGSSNSSNSVRLAEIAENRGTKAMRIDDVREINPQFLEDAERVLVTAGASAPEDLVQQVIAHLQANYNANIEVIDAPGEAMEFALPATMRKVLLAEGHEVPREGISIDADRVTRDWMEREAISFTPITAEGNRL